MNKTVALKHNNKQWYLIDATNQNLGRLSTKIASILIGKDQIKYTPYLINNTYVIIINAKFITITGQKQYQKIYKRHSGQPGGLKSERFKELQKRLPYKIIEKSVKGMLPKGVVGRKLFSKLKVYEGNNHPYSAQKPKIISIN
uniref:Ribosomal protein L13 n=1 Tax=Plocamium cartilagineum TaxID=31452 RepID=A0A1C9CHZ9_PLOCA|nr:ribosomal protein L13 [Plocamium cartilagineum]AOM68011.1 ribosomal protein L13 [Plocamium cartilagineum]